MASTSSPARSPRRSRPSPRLSQPDVPLRAKSFVGAALPTPEYIRWFQSKVKYGELLRFHADLTQLVAQSPGKKIKWPEIADYLEKRFDWFDESHPLKLLFAEKNGDNLRLLYEELCTSVRADADCLKAHRDYVKASFAQRLAVVCEVRAHHWLQLEDTEGGRLRLNEFRESFKKAELNGRASVDLDAVVKECSDFVVKYVQQGLHRRFPDVAKSYIFQYLRRAYEKFGFDFPIGEDVVTVQIAPVPLPTSAPESPLDATESQDEPSMEGVEVSSEIRPKTPDQHVAENGSAGIANEPSDSMEVDGEESSTGLAKPSVDVTNDVEMPPEELTPVVPTEEIPMVIDDLPTPMDIPEPPVTVPAPSLLTEEKATPKAPPITETPMEIPVPTNAPPISISPPRKELFPHVSISPPSKPPIPPSFSVSPVRKGPFPPPSISPARKEIPPPPVEVPSSVPVEPPAIPAGAVILPDFSGLQAAPEIPSPTLLPSSPMFRHQLPASTSPSPARPPAVPVVKAPLPVVPKKVPKKPQQKTTIYVPAIMSIVEPSKASVGGSGSGKAGDRRQSLKQQPVVQTPPAIKLEEEKKEEPIPLAVETKVDVTTLAPVKKMLEFLEQGKWKIPDNVLRALVIHFTVARPTDLVDYQPFKLPVTVQKYKTSVLRPQSIYEIGRAIAVPHVGDLDAAALGLPLVALNAVAYNRLNSEVAKMGLRMQGLYNSVGQQSIEMVQEFPDMASVSKEMTRLQESVANRAAGRPFRARPSPLLDEGAIFLGTKPAEKGTPAAAKGTGRKRKPAPQTAPPNLTTRTRQSKALMPATPVATLTKNANTRKKI